MAEANGKPTTEKVVSFGFAVLIGGIVWSVADRYLGDRASLTSELESRFVSKEVFQTEMEALRREAGMRQDEVMRRFDTLERRIEPPK
jgi:hypothetical protein